MSVIKIEQLKSSYTLDMFGVQKIVQAVNGVDLEIQENEVYGVAGESGSGKTTLVKTLFGDVQPPLRLVSGKVWYRVDGREVDLFAMKPEERRKFRWSFISYVPQSSMSSLNPVIKLKRTFIDFLGSRVHQMGKREMIESARLHLVELGLPPNVLEVYPHQLSGGMRQRVMIALASFLSPQVMIADEPVTALDVVVQRGVLQLLIEVHEQQKNALVFVTHDMGVLANIADRVGIMYAGKIIEEAKVEAIFDHPQHPYTQYLINSLPKFGDKERRESAPGSPPSLVNLPSGCAFHARCSFAKDICRQEVPVYRAVRDQHKVACWIVEEDGHRYDS
ncbi:MAG: ABC transporter ATP-binding protein [Caldilineaceae bacterium]|nr:ABC transporter ATP-binding protein [Caldilineaceae bacterium]